MAMDRITTGITYPSILVLMLLFGTCCGDNTSPPARFVFGDSLIDPGNNNFINHTLAKANYYPHGIDFGWPTGRFCHGRTVADITEFIPPYLDPYTKGSILLQGVNYASAAAGILKDSGSNFGARIDFDTQLTYFGKPKQNIIKMIGSKMATKLEEEAVFSVTIGSNDIVHKYLLNHSTPVQKLSVKAFVSLLISTFGLQIKRLYAMGARKTVLTNISAIGCIPYQREIHPSSGLECASFPNHIAQLFNEKLQDIVAELNVNLSGSRFVYADSYHIFNDILQNYP